MRDHSRGRVVFILSTNYAGSHLLAHLLGAHSLCFSLGELRNLRKLTATSGTNRNVVSDYAFNPIFDSLSSTPEASWHREILERIKENRPHPNTLIDNSKRIEWAVRHRDPGIDAFFIHLLRDPRALVCRWASTYDTSAKQCQQRRRLTRRLPHRSVALLRAPMEQIYLEKWLAANRRITRFLAKTSPTSDLVCYQDLAKQTARTLGDLMPGIGLKFEDSQLLYGEPGQFGTAKRDYLEHTHRSEIQFDGRWKSKLTREAQNLIVGHSGFRGYLEEIGISCTADGLTAFSDQ